MTLAARPIHVQYFAVLRDQRGQSEERLETTAASPRALYDELRARHGFTLDAEHLRVAINGRFSGWNDALTPDDLVVFIPPVAGG